MDLLKLLFGSMMMINYDLLKSEMQQYIETEVRAAEERGVPPEVVYGMMTCGTIQIELERRGFAVPLTAITSMLKSYRGYLLREYGRCPKCGESLTQDELDMNMPTCVYCIPWENMRVARVNSRA